MHCRRLALRRGPGFEGREYDDPTEDDLSQESDREPPADAERWLCKVLCFCFVTA